jgi:ATP adenylyltransferase
MKTLWAPWRMEYIIEAKEDTSERCIFCDKPKQKTDRKNLIVYRTENCFVMLNKYPYNNGHLMIIPYIHVPDPLLLDDKILLGVQLTINLAIRALDQTMQPHGLNIGMNIGRTAGAGIDDHIHWHLVPRWNGDTNFMPVISETKVVSEALDKTWGKLHKAFKKIG